MLNNSTACPSNTIVRGKEIYLLYYLYYYIRTFDVDNKDKEAEYKKLLYIL